MATETINEIESIEKAIKASENLRQKALTSKGIYEQQLKETDEELRKLGTTPEKGIEEIAKIDKTIQENIGKMNEMIPFELLKQYKML